MSSVARNEIEHLGPWFHNLHLPDGAQTAPSHPLGDFPSTKWRQVAPFIAEDLSGTTVLDVGCNAGFYSFELARRGARVTAIDIDARYLHQAQWAAQRFGLDDRIEFRRASLYSLAREPRTYDIVWFLGVLYHLRHPLLALDLVRRMTTTQLVLQTLTTPGAKAISPPADLGLKQRRVMNRCDWPRMAFIEHRLENDPTNWWAPNHACVEAMLRSAGFRIATRPGHEIYLCEPDRDETREAADLREQELRAVFS